MFKQLIIITFFISTISTYSQTHKAVYSYRIEHPEIDYVESYETVNELALHNELYVFFDKNESLYISENVLNGRIGLDDASTGAIDPLRFNKANNSVLLSYHDTYTNQQYCITYDVVPVWTITEETKNIDGYLCIKAVGKMEHITDPTRHTTIEAWFAPDIPYAYGPSSAVGLPGLVVYMVQNNRKKYKLERIIFNTEENILEKMTCEGEQLDRAGYSNLIKQGINY